MDLNHNLKLVHFYTGLPLEVTQYQMLGEKAPPAMLPSRLGHCGYVMGPEFTLRIEVHYIFQVSRQLTCCTLPRQFKILAFTSHVHPTRRWG